MYPRVSLVARSLVFFVFFFVPFSIRFHSAFKMATPSNFTPAVDSYWVLGDLYHFLVTKKEGRSIAVVEAVSYVS